MQDASGPMQPSIAYLHCSAHRTKAELGAKRIGGEQGEF